MVKKPTEKLVKILACVLVAAMIITVVPDLTTVAEAATLDIITTVAGSASYGYSGDGGAATEAQLRQPNAVVIDGAGNLYIADTSNNCIRMVPTANGTYFGIAMTAGSIYTVAGTGSYGYSGDGGPATDAQLRYPGGVAIDSAGNLYLADTNNHRIRKVNTGGTITTIAGTGEAGYSGDGGAATSAKLYQPRGIAIDSADNLYIADYYNNRIRKVNTGGTITTVAGTGTAGYSGDGGAATSAKLYYPYDVAIDSSGNLYIADTFNHRIRKVNTGGTITTVAGTGSYGYSGDGGAATSAKLYYPRGVATDSAGSFYIADNLNHRIRKVNTGGTITTVAGTGSAGYSGDGGAATDAKLNNPYGVAIDSAGNLYIADKENHRIRFVEFQAITLPLWTSTYPKAGTIDKTNIEILVKTDEDGAAYFVALPYGATAPTSTQVKAGQDASGTPVAANLKGTVALTANTEASFWATSLTAQTYYDFYVVAEENSGPNLQPAPVKVRVMTQEVEWRAAESCPDCHGITAGDFDLSLIDRNTVCSICHSGEKPYGSHVDLTLSEQSLNADASTVHPPHDGTRLGGNCEPCHTDTTTCVICHGNVPHEQHGSSQIEPVTVPYRWTTQEISCGNSSCHQTLVQGVQSGACTNCHTIGKDGHTAAPRTHSDFSVSTAACAKCHVVHAAPGPKLMRAVTQTELCYLCHGAGAPASPYDVQQGLTWNPAASAWQTSTAGGYSHTGGALSTSIHDIEGYGANQTAFDPGLAGFTGTIPGGSSSLTGRGLQCSFCHQPHGGTGNARLLRNNFFNGEAGKQVRMTTGSNMVISYDQGFTEWCAACHGRFNAGSGAGHIGVDFNGTTIYRHPMNVRVSDPAKVSDRSFSGTPLQTGKRTSDTTDDNLVVCVTCHRSHGTSAAATHSAATWKRDTGESGSGSALLRMNNRGVCYNCHWDTAENTIIRW